MIVAVFLTILGVTGALLAFEEPIDHLLNPALFYVQPQGTPMPLAAMLAGVKRAFPGERVSVLWLPQAPDLAFRVTARGRTIFLDPYTGRVLGTRAGQGFTGMIHNLHMRLLVGETGATIMSVASVVLIFLAVTGLILWWPLKRVTVALGKSWRRFNFDLHYAVGFYSSAFLLVLALTGVLIGFAEYTVPAMYSLTNSEPSDQSAESTPVKGATPISPDQALEIGAAALPGTRPVNVSIPPGPKAAYRVALRHPEDLTPGGRSRALIDQFSGKVLLAESSRTAPGGSRLVNLNRALHTGDVGGWPGKIVVCLMSLAVVAQVISGIVMWWKRRAPEARRAPEGVDVEIAV